MEPRQSLKLKMLFLEAPVITGFSYPFLRLMVSRLKEMHATGKLFIESSSSTLPPGWVRPTLMGAALLNHVVDQIKGGASFGTLTDYPIEEVRELIETAENFLDIFVPTDKELREMMRTPER